MTATTDAAPTSPAVATDEKVTVPAETPAATTEEKVVSTDEKKKAESVVDVDIVEEKTPFVINEADEREIVGKMDRNIIPWLTVMYFLSYLDRVNIGNARVLKSNSAGVGEMEATLGLTGDQYNWCVSIFFIGYCVFEVPSNLLLKRLRPSRWLSRIMVTWGILATCMAAVNSYGSLLAVRLLLGIAEAGLFPGALFYLSFWYRKHEYARRMSWFYSAASGAGAFAALLATGISYMDGAGGVSGWRWVFILEGLPPVVIGVFVWFFLPDFPSNAKFLSEKERKIAVERLKAEGTDADEIEFSKTQFIGAVTDIKVWLWMFNYLSMVVPVYSISFFLPTINRGLGFVAIQAQAMSAPPFIAACIASIVVGYTSDKFRDRSLHLIGGLIFASISFWCLAFVRNNAANYFLTIMATMSLYGSIPAILSWVSNNSQGSTYGATAMAMVVAFGNIGGVVGGQVYRTTDAPNYQMGHTINAALLIASAGFAIAQRLVIQHQRKSNPSLVL
ncbi:major facilitator superfamily domain-containing protein [Cladochytrium replicatum]|nr:major facilitator superfamily domain-containing protein [Cladochytrium replicatum]